jgi:hypothetical protein
MKLSERRKLLVALDQCGMAGNTLVTALHTLGADKRKLAWEKLTHDAAAWHFGVRSTFFVWSAWKGTYDAINSVRSLLDRDAKFLNAYRDEQRRLKLLEHVCGKRNTTRARGGLRSVRCAAPQSVEAGAGPKSRTAGGQAQARTGKSRGRR